MVAGTVEGATNTGVTPGNKQAIVTAAEAFPLLDSAYDLENSTDYFRRLRLCSRTE